jgi:hypothetical protein
MVKQVTSLRHYVKEMRMKGDETRTELVEVTIKAVFRSRNILL